MDNATKNKTPFSVDVKTKATFVDRPDMHVTDKDLDTAGWSDTDADRKKRQDKFVSLADQFSHVPTSVSVTVTGLSTGSRTFAPSAGDIAPAFKRNDAAIAPGFVEHVRFKLKSAEPRILAKMPDWAAFNKAKKKSADDQFIKNKLAHVIGKHAVDWGLPNTNATANLQALETRLEAFIKDTSNEQIEGVYVLNKVDVLHYVRHSDRLWACTELDGTLVASFKLNPGQYDILMKKGTVG
jgi:hypothetical protein